MNWLKTTYSVFILNRDIVDDYLTPCGACRQFIAEFGLDCNVILIKSKYDYKVISMQDMLPYSFNSSKLDMPRKKSNDSSASNIE